MYDLNTIVALNEAATNNSHPASVDVVREYVAQAIEGFVHDRPDSPFQRGYLSAFLAVAKEALHEDMHAEPYCAGEAILNNRPFCRIGDNPAHAARIQALTEAA